MDKEEKEGTKNVQNGSQKNDLDETKRRHGKAGTNLPHGPVVYEVEIFCDIAGTFIITFNFLNTL